jgi:hypothetical protein
VSAYDTAVRIARAGPRPAASRAEGRAQALVARGFRRAGLRVGVQRFRVPGRGRSRNVIAALRGDPSRATPRGDTPRSCLRVIMAHTDSAPGAPGADDNASGVGVLAAIAPRLKRLKPGCDVWLVATGAEERLYTHSPNHLGALALARRVRAHGGRRRLRWALALDEVGRDYPFWLRSTARGPRRRVERELLAAARATHVGVRWVRDEGSGNSDHREFGLLGLPGMKLGVGAGGEPCRHTPCDRPSRLRRSSLRAAQRAVEAALKHR